MNLRYLVPSLAAAAMAVPTASALELADGDASMKFGIRLQSRIEFASASDAAGEDFDPWTGSTTDDPQAINFYLRRVRLYLKGAYKEDTKYELTFYSDDLGASPRSRSSETSASSRGSRVAVRYAKVSHTIKSDDMKHTIQFGLDKPQLIAGHTDSSSKHLFPVGRYSGGGKEVDRKIGLEYQLSHPLFTGWIGYYEADAPLSGTDSDGNGIDDGEDLNDSQISLRIETPIKEEWKMKRTESMLGKEGFHHVAGVGVGFVDGGDDEDGNTIFTIDYNVHYNGLTANADFVLNTPEEDFGGTIGDQTIWGLQAGYAFPLETGHVAEVAARFYDVDNNDEDDNEMGVYEEEGGDSGSYFDIGVNYYFSGHNNKMQLALTSYSPEEGEGDATVVRIAHQLNF